MRIKNNEGNPIPPEGFKYGSVVYYSIASILTVIDYFLRKELFKGSGVDSLDV